MNATENFGRSFRVKAIAVFAGVLLVLLYRFVSGTLFTGLAGFCCGLEYGNVFYHLFIKTGIPAFVSFHLIQFLPFSISVCSVCLFCFC